MQLRRPVLVVLIAAGVLVTTPGTPPAVGAVDLPGVEQGGQAAASAVRVSPPADISEIRQFDVDGVTVVTRSAPRALPTRASIISFSGMLIDDGNGLEWCSGVVLDSFPPQCGGPVVRDLVPGDWAETVADVTFGSRAVITSWPPVDGTIDRLADGPAMFPTGEDPFATGFDFPAECAAIDTLVSVQVLVEYASRNTDRTASAYVSRNDAGVERGVLQVSGDLDQVRAELTVGGAEPCLVQVDFSRDELAAAQDQVGALFDAGIGLTATGSGNARNRLEVDVAVADVETVLAVRSVVDDPDILFVRGTAAIVAGR